MVRKFKSMDGNNAAAYVSYAFTEVAGIYPITPSSPMADYVDQWAANGQKNIFGDHSDVMACRQTGFAMLCENDVQEIMDLAPVAHLAAIEGRVPFINFFDGFRTSHEIQKVAVWDYEDLKEMCDMDAVYAFRKHSLNPERPMMRGSHENGDIFFLVT